MYKINLIYMFNPYDKHEVGKYKNLWNHFMFTYVVSEPICAISWIKKKGDIPMNDKWTCIACMRLISSFEIIQILNSVVFVECAPDLVEPFSAMWTCLQASCVVLIFVLDYLIYTKPRKKQTSSKRRVYIRIYINPAIIKC